MAAWLWQWEAKYADRLLTSEQLEQLKTNKAAAQKVAAEKAAVEENRSRKTEKQCSFNRLAAYDDEPPMVEQAKEELGYEKMRKHIAAEVRRSAQNNPRTLASSREEAKRSVFLFAPSRACRAPLAPRRRLWPPTGITRSRTLRRRWRERACTTRACRVT